jgi:hypothetical protein
MESWEDGHVSKQLEEKCTELQTKGAALEEHQKAVLQAEERVLLQQQQASSVSLGNINPKGSNSDSWNNHIEDLTKEPIEEASAILVRGTEVCTILDATESVESVHWHPSNVL